MCESRRSRISGSALGPANRWQHDRLEIAPRGVHRAVHQTPLQARQHGLIAVQLDQALAPEPAAEVQAWRRAAFLRA